MTLPILYWLSLATGVAYGAVYCWRDPSMVKSLVKTTALCALALFAVANGAPWLLVLALGLSALGDWALAAPGERRFLIGLAGFALAHVCYIALLVPGAGAVPVLPALLVVALALSTLFWLLPYAGAMRGAVLVYVVLITTMGVSALAQDDLLLRAGALAFIASDALLAVQLFRMSPQSSLQRPASISLWSLYYGGQLALKWGVML